jgi:tetratricopeptide (TPR) repeat protein
MPRLVGALIPTLLTCFAGILLLGVWLSLRAAWADVLYQRNTRDSLTTCISLTPEKADCHALLAEHRAGVSLDPEPESQRALKLDPFNSELLMRTGIRAEARGEYAQSERYLLRAAEVDRRFQPRWALTNYYFRRGDTVRFWLWARKALDMNYQDGMPLFRLAWKIADANDGEIRGHLHMRPFELRLYFAFLTEEYPSAARSLAQSLASGSGPEDVPRLLDYCDRVLSSDHDSALTVWNTLCLRKLLPFEPLDPERGDAITNGNFQSVPIQRGFDWRFSGCEGISIEFMPDAAAMRVQFTGKEAEDCAIASQPLPGGLAGRYRLEYEYRIDDQTLNSADSFAGLSWQLEENAPQSNLTSSSAEFERGDGWKEGEVTVVSRQPEPPVLTLHYHRSRGTVEAEGTVLLRRIHMRKIP